MAFANALKRAPELQSIILNGAEETGRLLGTGSFGSVVELKIGGVLCAGKKLHDILVDKQNEGATRMELKFLEECKLMCEVRHPHIAQFMGICFLPSSSKPLLVTELLSDSLHNLLESRDDLPLQIKQSILTDVAKGLVYLHSRSPPIIHRDLTARNVLLDKTMKMMKAKIADFGNSQFVDPIENSKTMTRVPGTLEYMPPEALEAHSRYSEKLDIFSFGHLSLFVITQVFPKNILAATSYDDTEKLIARTEVERRAQYMELLHDRLKDNGPLATLVQQCLHNSPSKRPTALEALDWLDDAIALDNLDNDEDAYETHYDTLYETFNKTEMVQYMSRKELERQMKEKEIEDLRKQIESMASYESPEPADRIKIAPLEKLCKGKGMRKHNWKLYTFKIVDGTHLKYFKSGVNKPRGEIALSSVTKVLPVEDTRGEGFCFEVHFKGRQSPWLLSAFSERERKSWIEVICKDEKLKMKQCSAYATDVSVIFAAQLETSKPSRKRNASESEPIYEEIDSLPDDLYEDLPMSSQASHSTGEKEYNYVSFTSHVSQPSEELYELPNNCTTTTPMLPHSPLNVPNEVPPEKCLEEVYEEISDNCATTIPMLPHSSSTVSTAAQLTEKNMEDVYEDLPDNYTTTPVPPLPLSPLNTPTATKSEVHRTHAEGPMYEETVAILGRTASFLNFSQIDHLIGMLQGAQSSLSGEDEIKGLSFKAEVDRSAGEVTNPHSTPPPSQDTEANPCAQSSHNNPDIYSTLPTHDSQLGRTSKQPLQQPAFDVNSPLPQPRPRTQSVFRRNLRKMLEETTALRNVSLLITEDDSPDEYIQRPQWAKASTLYPRLDSLTELHHRALYISPSALLDINEIGEGQFGKVYKAQLKRKLQNVEVAIKVVDNISPDLQKEITIMTEIIHPNIVHLYGLMKEGPLAPAMIMEYLPNGNLKNFLTENKRDDRQLTKYMMDVAIGMHYLSEKGIIHRDLAARNVLVDKDETCKVADFGLVREVPKESSVYISQSQGPSPLRWMAPESLAQRAFSHASDVWSFGVLQWEMFNPTRMPYPDMSNNEVMVNVAKGYRMPVPRRRPPLVIKIMKACWNEDPVKRPSFILISHLLTKQMIGED